MNQYSNVEFLILDYNSQDGLEDWVREQFGTRLGQDINFYAERTRKFFFMAHAKNVAALLASGDIIVNLDADQFMAPDFGHKVAQVLESPNCIATPAIGPWKHKNPPSTGGVLAMRAEDFRVLGGYDEDMRYGWGVEDRDMRQRAMALGYRNVRFPSPWNFIRHHDRTRNQNTEHKMSKTQSGLIHRQIHAQSMREKRFVANTNRIAGQATVIRNFSVAVEVGMIPRPIALRW